MEQLVNCSWKIGTVTYFQQYDFKGIGWVTFALTGFARFLITAAHKWRGQRLILACDWRIIAFNYAGLKQLGIERHLGRHIMKHLAYSFARRAILFTVLLLIVFSIPACSKKVPESKEINIGCVFALTGKAAQFGVWVKNGADLAIEEINDSGGRNGYKLKLLVEDTQSEPKLAVSAFNKLISLNKVTVAIGFVSSSEALVCAPIAEKSKVVMITPVAGTPELKDAGDYIFRTRESGLLQSYKIAGYIFNDLGHKKAAIIYENAANAVGYKEAFIEEFTRLGGQIQLNESYEEGQTDFRAILTKVKSLNPRAIYVPGVGSIIGRILKQAKELGIDAEFFSSAGIEDPELFKIAGDAAEGVIFGSPAFSVDSTDSHTKQFVSKYRNRYGDDPSVYAANAYDTVMLIAGALKDTGSTKSDDIKRYLYQIKDYQGASGQITFDSYGEVVKPIILKKIVNGNFTALNQE